MRILESLAQTAQIMTLCWQGLAARARPIFNSDSHHCHPPVPIPPASFHKPLPHKNHPHLPFRCILAGPPKPAPFFAFVLLRPPIFWQLGFLENNKSVEDQWAIMMRTTIVIIYSNAPHQNGVYFDDGIEVNVYKDF